MYGILAELLQKTTMESKNKIDIAIYIQDAEAKKWLLFQEYYEPFSLLVEKEVFKQRNAAISLHFDHSGVLQTIQRADFLYSRKFDK